MVWRCAECGEPEADKAFVACHHCGKPLCNDDRQATGNDVFREIGNSVGVIAYHCLDCYREHHATTAFAG